MNIDISNNTQVSQNNYAECKSDHKKKKKSHVVLANQPYILHVERFKLEE